MASNSTVREVLDWIVHIAIAVLIGVLIVTFVAQRTYVHDISMQPTLYEGDNLIVEKISPKIGALKPGDIIVFYEPSEKKQLIKRLIAVEGDRVEIKDGKVYVNGEAREETNINSYITPQGPIQEYNSLTVEKGYVYVLGDNRPNSRDSRSLGPISVKQITGKAVFRFYPFNKFGTLK